MNRKHTTLVMAPVALLLALLASLLVSHHAEATPELQDAHQFVGPIWAWDSQGKPVDPIDEAREAAYTANNPSGYLATPVESTWVSGTPAELSTQCGSVDTMDDRVSGEDIDALVAAGFWAPYDYQEVLYSPACAKDSLTQAYERGQADLADPTSDSNTLCYSDNVGEDSGITEEIFTELLGAGFYPDPTDHMEALYSPGCRADRYQPSLGYSTSTLPVSSTPQEASVGEPVPTQGVPTTTETPVPTSPPQAAQSKPATSQQVKSAAKLKVSEQTKPSVSQQSKSAKTTVKVIVVIS